MLTTVIISDQIRTKRVSLERTKVKSSGIVGCFDETEEETTENSAGIVLGDGGKTADDCPEHHAATHVPGRANSSDNHVGRDLAENVTAPRFRTMFSANSIGVFTYPTNKMEIAVLYSVLDKPSSSSNPLSRARVMALRSRKLSQYMSQSIGWRYSQIKA